jgi:hypothetical protein
MPEQLMTREPPCVQPERRGQAWRGVLYVAISLACLAITIVILVAVVSPSAGAAGGCGGG